METLESGGGVTHGNSRPDQHPVSKAPTLRLLVDPNTNSRLPRPAERDYVVRRRRSSLPSTDLTVRSSDLA